MAAVELRSVSKSFGAVPVLSNLTLTIEEGEFFFLLGPSGCGKTTLLRIIAGFLTPDSGSLLLQGKEIENLPPHKRGIAMVFQSYALWPHLTVAENVAFGLEMRKLGAPEIKERVNKVLEVTDITALAKRYPQELSGGQQQRVALARAIVVEPALILLDEPLSNLDAKLRLEMRHELRELHKRIGKTMIYVTHDQGEALALGSRIAVLNRGTVAQLGTPREILLSPKDPFVQEFVGRTGLLSGEMVAQNGGSVRISSGTIPCAEATGRTGSVTVAVRAEHAVIIDD